MTDRFQSKFGSIAFGSCSGDAAALSKPGMFFRRWLANPLQMGSVVPFPPASVWLHANARASMRVLMPEQAQAAKMASGLCSNQRLIAPTG
jgi:hypothetical protein